MATTPQMKLPSVLVVDDQRVVRDAVVDTLGLMDVELLATDNVDDALATARSHRPDLVLCDIVLPGRSGYDFLAEVRNDAELSATLVVLMTGVSSMQDRLRAVDLGADDLLTKPFDQAELISRVKALLRLKAREDEVKAANEKMRQRVFLMSTLFAVGNQLRESLNSRDVLRVIQETLGSIVGVATFSIYVRKRVPEPLGLVIYHGSDSPDPDASLPLASLPEPTLGKLIHGESFFHEGPPKTAPRLGGLPLMAVVPLVVEKQLVGVINIHSFAPDRGDVLDFEMAALLSSQVTSALLAANMQSELREYAAELADTSRALQHTTRDLGRQMSHVNMLMLFSAQLHSVDDLEVLLSVIRDMLVNLVGVASYRLVYQDHGRQQVVTGVADSVAPQAAPDDWESVVRTVLETGEHVRAPESGIVIGLPLLVSGHAQAALLVERLLPQKAGLTDEDLEILSLLAHEVAIALSTVTTREHQAARRRDFYAMLAHDFRSPLSSQSMALEMLSLERASLDEIHQEMLDICIRTNQHVMGLLDDFLTYSQLQAGAMELHRSSIDLRTVVREAADAMSLVIEYRDQTLEVDLPESPVMGDVDSNLLSRVLANLLSNASKYTGTGGRIALTLETADETVLVHVADNGPGISSDDIGQLFQSYHRVGDERRQKKGTGLGLVVVKEVVENHGGRVWVSSDGIPGKGSVFSFALPLEAPLPAPVDRSID